MENFVSPDGMMDRGKQIMLDGRDPVSEEDWIKLVSFWAGVIAKEVQPEAIQLLCKLHDAPMSAQSITVVCGVRALYDGLYKRRKEDEIRGGTQRGNISTD